MLKCLNCNKELNKRQIKYCSNQCQSDFQYKQYIKRWKNGEEDGLSGQYALSKYIRRYLLEKNNNKCSQCGWGEINKFTNTLPLEIDHIDGDYRNNKEENLRVLCPNCHSLTPTYKGANKKGREGREQYSNRKIFYCQDCGKEISFGSTRCRECQDKNKTTKLEDMPITREELKDLIRIFPFTQIGIKYKVSDNAIRKWCEKFNLPRTKKEINSYSNEEWDLV